MGTQSIPWLVSRLSKTLVLITFAKLRSRRKPLSRKRRLLSKKRKLPSNKKGKPLKKIRKLPKSAKNR